MKWSLVTKLALVVLFAIFIIAAIVVYKAYWAVHGKVEE